MKFPALARVFSVVLAILGLIFLFNGVRGFGKNNAEHEERLAYEEKFEGRIENYRQLHEELENSADFDETMAALEKLLTEHEKAAAKHKTDTATYTATKGGLKMGEDLIVQARAQMDEIRQQMKDTDDRHAFLEGLLTEIIASNKNRLPWLDALANTAAEYAVDCYLESAKITVVTSKLRALMEAEPTPESVAAVWNEPPAAPAMPVLPQFPDPDAAAYASYDALQAAYQAAMSQYQSAADAYMQAGEQYAQQMQSYYDDMAQTQMERLNQAQQQAMGMIEEQAYSAQYQWEHDAWKKECGNVKKEADFLKTCVEIRRLGSALSSLVRQANGSAASLAAETGGFYPGMEELVSLSASTADRLERLAGSDLSGMSNEEFLKLAEEVQEILDLLGDAFSVVASNLYNPAGLIADLMDKLHLTEILAEYLEYMLDRADREIQGQLELLWYQLGETEKDELKLEAEKLGLDKEAVLLSKKTVDAEELKDLRNRHIKAQQLLFSVPEVKSGHAESGDLVGSAREYLRTYSGQTGRLYLRKLLINALAVAGGLMAVIGIPAAYELVRSRFLLLAPVLLCLVCAAAADALNLALGLGHMYTALFTGIFALLDFAVVAPKRKKPAYAPRH